MKLIIAFIRPEQLPAIKDSLSDEGLSHFTVMPVMGTAPKAEQRMFRGVEQKVTLFKRMRMEFVVKDSDVERLIDAISKGAMSSGGAGRIFVTNVEDAIKIWTGERGDGAI